MSYSHVRTCCTCIGFLAHFLGACSAWKGGGAPAPRRALLRDQLTPLIGAVGVTAATCTAPTPALVAPETASQAAAASVPAVAQIASGVLWRTASRDAVPATPSSLARIMREEVFGPVSSAAACSSGMVCISERHDDFEHHKVQLKVLMTMKKVLAERKQDVSKKLSIGMEMFQRRHQRHLDRYIANANDAYELADLMRDTNWESTWGYDILHYLPILLFAQKHRIRVLGLHPSDEEVERVQRLGLRDARVLADVRLDDRAHAREFRRAYAHQLSPAELAGGAPGAAAALARRYEVQCFREEHMAATAAAHAAGPGRGGWLALLAGERHVRRRRGLPGRARRRTAPAARGRGVFVVVPRTGTCPGTADAPGTEEADHLWYVQRDAGAEFREGEVNRAPLRSLDA